MGEFKKQPIKLEWALTKPGTSWLIIMPAFPLTLHPTYLSHELEISLSLSDGIPLPTASTFLMFIVTFSSSFPLSLSFPCVPINLFPVHSSAQGLSVPITAGPSSPRLTHSAHSPLSLSLYQLGINPLKQRASWRAAHRRPCEVLPLHRSTLLPILRTTYLSNLFPTVLATKQIWAQGLGTKTEERKRKAWNSGLIVVELIRS